MPRRLTTEEFIAKARSVHGDRYDYSETTYVTSTTKVRIGCSEHGPFDQIPNRHLSDRRGCPACTQIRVADSVRLSTADFIARAKAVHGDTYDYSATNYCGARAQVTVLCPTHGAFRVIATAHTTKAVGCPACTRLRVNERLRASPDEWLSRLKGVLGEGSYDYTDARYVDRSTPVRLVCREHGPFERKPPRLMNGIGCSECRRIEAASQRIGARSVRWTTEQFIARAREIFGDRYDYSRVEYEGAWSKVTIICSTHGPFEKAPVEHIHRGRGCARCAHAERARRSMQSTAEWVAKAQTIHGHAYDYSRAEYNGAKVAIEVVCPRHGGFMANPEAHLRGNGCARCRQSLGERTVASALDSAGVVYVAEFSDDTLRADRALRFDFALLDQRVLIEFDGEQHRRVVQWGGETPEEAAARFLRGVERDAMKTRWAAENGWRLIRICEVSEVEQTLRREGVLDDS